MSPTTIEREILIEAPQELVWRVVTESAQISQWFSDAAQIDLRPGGDGALVFDQRATSERATDPMTVHLVVDAVEPPYTFAFRWAYPQGAEPDSGNSLRVELTLTAEGQNTRLRLMESGFEQVDWSQQQKTGTLSEHEKGWDIHLARLRDHAARQSAEAQRQRL